MSSNYIFTIFIFIIQRMNSFLIISLKINIIDDCIRKIELVDNAILYERDRDDCPYEASHTHYDIPEIIPYEIGQKIKIVIRDNGAFKGICGINVDIIINNNTIKNDNLEFWSCDNCNNSNFMIDDNILSCFSGLNYYGIKDYNFYFQINSLHQLDFQIIDYFYILNNANYFFISTNDFTSSINFFDLYSKNN